MATIFYTAATLDGFLADDNDSLEWLMPQDIDLEDESAYPHFLRNVGAIIAGASTACSTCAWWRSVATATSCARSTTSVRTTAGEPLMSARLSCARS